MENIGNVLVDMMDTPNGIRCSPVCTEHTYWCRSQTLHPEIGARPSLAGKAILQTYPWLIPYVNLQHFHLQGVGRAAHAPHSLLMCLRQGLEDLEALRDHLIERTIAQHSLIHHLENAEKDEPGFTTVIQLQTRILPHS